MHNSIKRMVDMELGPNLRLWVKSFEISQGQPESHPIAALVRDNFGTFEEREFRWFFL